MERDELARRYQKAQFHAMAQAAAQSAEQKAVEGDTETAQQPSSEPEKPDMMSIVRKAAGLDGAKRGLDDYVSPDDRLRRYCGLK